VNSGTPLAVPAFSPPVHVNDLPNLASSSGVALAQTAPANNAPAARTASERGPTPNFMPSLLGCIAMHLPVIELLLSLFFLAGSQLRSNEIIVRPETIKGIVNWD
jgi:hypothetical protein